MKIFSAIIAALWLCLSIALPAHSADEFHGKWSLEKSRERGSMQLVLTHRNPTGEAARHRSAWSVTALSVLDPEANASHAVAFAIESKIGRIECRGFMEGGAGAGAFTFKLSKEYLESMRPRGYIEIGEDEQLALALRDLGSDFTRAMTASRVDH